ncbi:hypothetical protein [Burkholderia sp. BE17]|uniref:hypothetical protein n=1 Tax=Burkholderia sp. BE17 TaxID=2656644 RepID=UPI001D0F55DF|nr:hypothetical protein [Burkholderia sp. BE17]
MRLQLREHVRSTGKLSGGARVPDCSARLSAPSRMFSSSAVKLELGGARNPLDLMSENHAAQLIANGQAVSLVGELDFAKATDQLNNYLTAIKGSYHIYGRMKQLSLVDVIRGRAHGDAIRRTHSRLPGRPV